MLFVIFFRTIQLRVLIIKVLYPGFEKQDFNASQALFTLKTRNYTFLTLKSHTEYWYSGYIKIVSKKNFEIVFDTNLNFDLMSLL